MRVSTMLLSTLAAAGLAVTGCTCGPGGCMQPAYNAPPAQQLMHPGPGVGGPGPGVLPVGGQMTMGGGPGMGPAFGPGGSSASGINQCSATGVEQVQYCEGGGAGMAMMPAASQIAFVGEDGLQISWDVSGSGMFDSSPLVVPGRQDFRQGAIYRLKLTNIPGREAISLYPTLEVAPVTPRTDAYLAHAPIPVQFTEEDFDQVVSGNFVTKVIYLPDPEFQELALAGVETLVSTRLDPGCDPVAEADRRGSILAIVRMGNKDLESSSNYMGGVTPADYEGSAVSASAGPMPMGMPTAGMAPAAVPPHMMMPGQYGMPITGTPIGLPGPPHIPLGVPAGLQKHSITNRTRVHLPPPTQEMNITVKQRPGINYPAPVSSVMIDETNRAPLKCIGGTVPCPIQQMSCSGEDGCQCETCQGYCGDDCGSFVQ